MSLSGASNFDEDEHDVLAIYENQELDKDKDEHSIQRNDDVYEASDNEEKDDETTARRIDPTSKKHVVRNPIPKLNTERLKGPKGIHTIEKYFEGFKFHGHGYEKSDLARIMKRLEHWGHRLFPKLEFDDFLERVQKLGTKKDLQVFIKKYRQDMINEQNDIVNEDIIDAEEDNEPDEPIDEFDLLIAEQIEKQKQVMNQSLSEGNNAAFDKLLTQSNVKVSEPETNTSSTSLELTDEVKERIERNKQQAIQRRLARLKEREEEAKRKKLEESKHTQSENNGTAHLDDIELESTSHKKQNEIYEA